MVKTNTKWKKRNRKRKLRKMRKAKEKLNKTLTSEDGLMKNEDMKQFKTYVKVQGVDESLGLVFGWGIICKKDGEDYFDHGGDNIPEKEMLDATFDFMKNSQMVSDMHSGDDHGAVLFSMPLTEEIAKAFGIQCDKTGWMIGAYPEPELFAKFVSGEYTGFSIGGLLEAYDPVD